MTMNLMTVMLLLLSCGGVEDDDEDKNVSFRENDATSIFCILRDVTYIIDYQSAFQRITYLFRSFSCLTLFDTLQSSRN